MLQKTELVISDVYVRRIIRPINEAFKNPVHKWTEKNILLAFVETRCGLLGVGEINTFMGTGEPAVAAFESELKPLLIDSLLEDPMALSAKVRRICSLNQSFGVLGAAWSGVESALWDVLAQKAGQPLYRLLGGGPRDIPIYASGGLYSDGDLVEAISREAQTYVDAGYQAMKLKVAGAPPAVDVARVQAVREVMGPDARIMVDAVGALGQAEAHMLADRLAPAGIHWFESPISITDEAGLPELRRRSGLRIAAHENLFGLGNYARLIRTGATDYAIVNPTSCGGVQETQSIANFAAGFNLPTTFQYSGSIVGFALCLQLAAAQDTFESMERHRIHHWLTEFSDGLEWSGDVPCLVPGSEPGAGLSQTVRERFLSAS